MRGRNPNFGGDEVCGRVVEMRTLKRNVDRRVKEEEEDDD